MPKLVRVLAVVALAAAALSIAAIPAQAAPSDYAQTEDSKSWFDSAQNTTYTMHVRHKVTEDPAFSPDQWRWTARGWCTKQVGPSGQSQSTPCNMDFFDAALTRCSVGGGLGCDDTFSFPWGFGQFERDNDSDHTFIGGWHDQPANVSDKHYMTAVTGRVQFRFLSSTGNHLTNVYLHCANGEQILHIVEPWPNVCRNLIAV